MFYYVMGCMVDMLAPIRECSLPEDDVQCWKACADRAQRCGITKIALVDKKPHMSPL